MFDMLILKQLGLKLKVFSDQEGWRSKIIYLNLERRFWGVTPVL